MQKAVDETIVAAIVGAVLLVAAAAEADAAQNTVTVSPSSVTINVDVNATVTGNTPIGVSLSRIDGSTFCTKVHLAALSVENVPRQADKLSLDTSKTTSGTAPLYAIGTVYLKNPNGLCNFNPGDIASSPYNFTPLLVYDPNSSDPRLKNMLSANDPAEMCRVIGHPGAFTKNYLVHAVFDDNSTADSQYSMTINCAAIVEQLTSTPATLAVKAIENNQFQIIPSGNAPVTITYQFNLGNELPGSHGCASTPGATGNELWQHNDIDVYASDQLFPKGAPPSQVSANRHLGHQFVGNNGSCAQSYGVANIVPITDAALANACHTYAGQLAHLFTPLDVKLSAGSSNPASAQTKRVNVNIDLDCTKIPANTSVAPQTAPNAGHGAVASNQTVPSMKYELTPGAYRLTVTETRLTNGQTITHTKDAVVAVTIKDTAPLFRNVVITPLEPDAIAPRPLFLRIEQTGAVSLDPNVPQQQPLTGAMTDNDHLNANLPSSNRSIVLAPFNGSTALTEGNYILTDTGGDALLGIVSKRPDGALKLDLPGISQQRRLIVDHNLLIQTDGNTQPALLKSGEPVFVGTINASGIFLASDASGLMANWQTQGAAPASLVRLYSGRFVGPAGQYSMASGGYRFGRAHETEPVIAVRDLGANLGFTIPGEREMVVGAQNGKVGSSSTPFSGSIIAANTIAGTLETQARQSTVTGKAQAGRPEFVVIEPLTQQFDLPRGAYELELRPSRNNRTSSSTSTVTIGIPAAGKVQITGTNGNTPIALECTLDNNLLSCHDTQSSSTQLIGAVGDTGKAWGTYWRGGNTSTWFAYLKFSAASSDSDGQIQTSPISNSAAKLFPGRTWSMKLPNGAQTWTFESREGQMAFFADKQGYNATMTLQDDGTLNGAYDACSLKGTFTGDGALLHPADDEPECKTKFGAEIRVKIE